MHLRYTDRRRLAGMLLKFYGGQFLEENKDGLIYRGEIESWVIPDMNRKQVRIRFKWLCEKRFGMDKNFFVPVPKWVLVKLPPNFELVVDYTSYYFQRERKIEKPKKPARRARIKLFTTRGICRFFQKFDPSNLTQSEDEFLPCSFSPGSDSDSDVEI